MTQPENDSYKIKLAGMRIPGLQFPVLTDPFVRVDTNPHKAQEGTGLGLSIVKSLVDLHDGELNIESEVGKGNRGCGDAAKRDAVI